jgi:hypothetical protein
MVGDGTFVMLKLSDFTLRRRAMLYNITSKDYSLLECDAV